MAESLPPESEPARPRVSGKTLAVRTLVGGVLAPVVLLITYRGGAPFALLVAALAGLGCYEFFAMFGRRDVRPSSVVGIAGSAAIPVALHWGSLSAVNALLVLVMLVIFGERLARSRREHYGFDAAVSVAGVLYTGWLLGTFVLLRDADSGSVLGGRPVRADGRDLVYFVLALTWSYDTIAYIGGSFVGRRRLLPHVSPSKTVEGTLCGLGACVGASVIAASTFAEYLTYVHAVVLGVVLAAAAQAGDLVESMIKRSTGTKDSSNLIPGHGGFLDRFDSLLFTGPAFYLYLRWFLR